MKILYLHRTQAKGVEGVHIRGIVGAMRQAGHEVQVIGPPGTDPYAKGGGPARPTLASRFAKAAPEFAFELAELLYELKQKRRLQQFAAGFQPDLIYERFAFFAYTGSRLADRLGVPHIIEVNYTCADPLVRSRSRLLMPIARRREKRIFRRATVLSAVSSTLRDRLLAMGVKAERIVLTPNAVDRAWWREAKKVAPQPLPPQFAGLPVTGYIGGFYAWHRIDLLLQAAGRCAAQGFRTALILVGDGPERPAIQARLAGEGLEAMTLLPGQVPHAELNRWIASMDICTLPASNDYCSPMKLFEYMAFGKTILAPDLPNTRDVIEPGVNGVLFGTAGDQDEAGAFTESLLALLRDPDLRRRVGEQARRTVWERHTWQENVRRLFLGAGLADPYPPDGSGPPE